MAANKRTGDWCLPGLEFSFPARITKIQRGLVMVRGVESPRLEVFYLKGTIPEAVPGEVWIITGTFIEGEGTLLLDAEPVREFAQEQAAA